MKLLLMAAAIRSEWLMSSGFDQYRACLSCVVLRRMMLLMPEMPAGCGLGGRGIATEFCSGIRTTSPKQLSKQNYF